MSLPSSVEGAGDVLRTILTFPIIPTQSRPITVTTFLAVGVTLTAAFWASRWIQRIVQRRVLVRLRLDPGLEFSILRFAHYAVLAVGVLFGLQTLRVDLTGLAVVAGVLGVGIGFGLQNVASNFISGIILLIERPITVGDHVSVGDVNGVVRSINMRSTEVVTNDNISIIVPNSEFVTARVVNWSHGDPRLRLRIPVGVAFGSDVERVSRTLLEVAGAQPAVLAEPQPEVRFVGFGDSALELELLVWVPDAASEEVVPSALRRAIHAAFVDAGIEIPFPQRDLHVRWMPSLSLLRGAAEEGHGPAASIQRPEDGGPASGARVRRREPLGLVRKP